MTLIVLSASLTLKLPLMSMKDVAYKAAAAEAIEAATIIEKTVDDDIYFAFEYPFMNDVMRIVKEEEPEILEQSYDMDCLMRLRIRRSLMPKLMARLEKVESLRFIEEEKEEIDDLME